MEFSKNILESIQKRRSVRSYDREKTIETEKRSALEKMMQSLQTKAFRFQIVNADLAHGEKIQLGTYGIIKGARVYLLGIMNSKSKEDVIAFGRAYEYLILKATELDLGTCWLVGTFDKKAFAAAVDLQEEEDVVMVSPLGYDKEAHLGERMLRSILKSSKRQDWSKLFFSETMNTPLDQTNLDVKYSTALQMLRRAPSAGNTQPWRVIKDKEENYHFYLDTKKMYKTKRHHCGYNDMGIAKAHFELAAQELGIIGEWRNENLTNLSDNRYEYLFSWRKR